MRPSFRDLLWVDCTAALSVGTAVLLAAPWLAPFYGFPLPFLWFHAGVNLAYGAYGLPLARRQTRPRGLVYTLIIANACWAVACLGFAWYFAGTATVFGLASMISETFIVGGLALLEWRQREQLLVAR